MPRTPTSASSASAILMSSPMNTSDIFQVKQEEIEYQLLSPISASSPMNRFHNQGKNFEEKMPRMRLNLKISFLIEVHNSTRTRLEKRHKFLCEKTQRGFVLSLF